MQALKKKILKCLESAFFLEVAFTAFQSEAIGCVSCLLLRFNLFLLLNRSPARTEGTLINSIIK